VSNFNTVLNGVCVDKPPPAVGASAGASQLGDLATLARQSAASGGLDTGYPVTGVGLQEPLIPQARAANNVSYPSTPEIQRVILVGRLWTLAPPLPPPPPSPPPPPPPSPAMPPLPPRPVLGVEL
jgi:hypothetical protein